MMIYSLGEFSSPRVRALYTTRSGGVSGYPYDDGNASGGFNLATHVGDANAHVQSNRSLLARQLPGPVLWLNQVHGTAVVNLTAPLSLQQPPVADASATRQAHLVLAILTADCLPVVLASEDGTVIGAAHAGWRGLQAGVLENTVQAMRQMHSKGAREPINIEARFGVAIGPAQFEVGPEVVDQFCANDSDLLAGFTPRADRWLANLYWLAQRRLARCGVTLLDGEQGCTVTQKESFYSYRRDGVTGRQATLVWLG
jgi:polyphenol oxidase